MPARRPGRQAHSMVFAIRPRQLAQLRGERVPVPGSARGPARFPGSRHVSGGGLLTVHVPLHHRTEPAERALRSGSEQFAVGRNVFGTIPP